MRMMMMMMGIVVIARINPHGCKVPRDMQMILGKSPHRCRAKSQAHRLNTRAHFRERGKTSTAYYV